MFFMQVAGSYKHYPPVSFTFQRIVNTEVISEIILFRWTIFEQIICNIALIFKEQSFVEWL